MEVLHQLGTVEPAAQVIYYPSISLSCYPTFPKEDGSTIYIIRSVISLLVWSKLCERSAAQNNRQADCLQLIQHILNREDQICYSILHCVHYTVL